MDAAFLYIETPSQHMHVVGTLVLDPSTMPGGYSFDTFREMLRSRLHLLAPFRRRIVSVPLNLGHPFWIEDPDFDLDQHLHHIAVPPPGGHRELAALAADLVKMPLDRSRPLWECWIVEGLEGGNVAALTKVHHAAIDGVAGNEITVAMLQLAPDEEPPSPAEEWKPDRVPTDIELLAYAASSIARSPWRVAKTSRRTIESTLRVRQRNRRPDVDPPPGLFNAPRTSFNAALTPHRDFALTSLSLPDVKMVKNALGVSVNDVVLGLCAGALRKYLEHVGEQPDGPLVAMVPVSVRTEEQKGTHGNQVSSMLCSLATDVDDPVDRLLTIHRGTTQAKEQINIIGAEALTDWVEFAAPAVLGRAVRLYSRTRMADRHRPLFNVTISNVPGPPFALYSAGARMIAHYPMGPIFDGGGLNITLMSYMDRIDFGLVACSDLIDDVWFIADGLSEAVEELKKAVDARGASARS